MDRQQRRMHRLIELRGRSQRVTAGGLTAHHAIQHDLKRWSTLDNNCRIRLVKERVLKRPEMRSMVLSMMDAQLLNPSSEAVKTIRPTSDTEIDKTIPGWFLACQTLGEGIDSWMKSGWRFLLKP